MKYKRRQAGEHRRNGKRAASIAQGKEMGRIKTCHANPGGGTWDKAMTKRASLPTIRHTPGGIAGEFSQQVGSCSLPSMF